ncbi:MAG: Flp family type IVb pilin [Desulfuromonas sp.]|nr:MAG: Flp family type IVb pilin [Desulfuromonas sp.]
MTNITKWVKGFFRDEEGATAVEYGVMVALIIAAVVAIVAILGTQIQEGFQDVSDELTAAGITGGG